ncbi:hypothetical protein L218DRAFT_818144, partial [Marasmius fiardii PR-910]
HFYFWSHEPSGQNPLSPDMCKYLGLPFRLSMELEYCEYSWPTRIYKALHDYQIARGFDPKTTMFAQFLGFPIFNIVSSE